MFFLKKFFLISFFMCIVVMVYSQSHFDNVEWKNAKIKEDRDVTLYTIKGKDSNYYKGEIVVKNEKIDAKKLFDAINDYQQYMEIFKKIRVFQSVGQADKGDVVYVDADFSPMKHRIYYIVLWTQCTDDTFIVEWEPCTNSEVVKPLEKNQKLVTQVYGRWIFKNNEDGSVYISNEYHNNWEYSGIPLSLATGGEQNVSVNNIHYLIDYCENK